MLSHIQTALNAVGELKKMLMKKIEKLTEQGEGEVDSLQEISDRLDVVEQELIEVRYDIQQCSKEAK